MSYTLITGASSGIGWEMAHVFAEKKHDLILVARSEDKLQKLKKELESKHGIKAQVVASDLSKNEASQILYQAIKSQNWAVENLVNNAGFGDHGDFASADWKKQKEMIQVNIMALTELTHLFLGEMLKRKSGRIMNVASTAAFQPGPLMSVYYATKSYVLSFSEGLHEELHGTGVTVTVLCPGPTVSGFQSAANMNNVALFESAPLPSSRDVADYGYESMMQGRLIAIHGAVNKVMANSVRFFPRAITRKLVKKLQEKRQTQ